MPTVMTSAPAACRNSRREILSEFMVSSLRSRSGSALDCAHDRHVGAAAAFESRERGAYLRIRRFGGVAQQRRRGHHPAVDAIAALRHLFFDVRGLQGMWPLGG